MSPNLKLLISAVLTSGLAAGLLSNDIYLFTPYAREALIQGIGEFVPMLPLWVILATPFAFFFVWPLALFGEYFLSQVMRTSKWRSWLALGALFGAVAMVFYSAVLGLGFTLWFALMANGALFGVICSALARSLIGTQIHGAGSFDAEASDGVATAAD